MDVELNGRKIDLSRAFPLKVADWKALGKIGITPDRLAGKVDVDALCGYALFVLRKADATVPTDEIDNLPFTGLLRLLKQMGEYEASVDKIDVPFSPSVMP